MCLKTTSDLCHHLDAADLRIGRPVRVQFDAYPGLALSGRVEGIGAMARSTGSRASFVADIPLTISLDGNDARVIPGLTVHCDVEVDSGV